MFKTYTDPKKDVVRGDVVRHIGYRGLETYDDQTIRKYDMLHIGVPIGDGKETALVFTNVVGVN